jgi:hypothetical protein
MDADDLLTQELNSLISERIGELSWTPVGLIAHSELDSSNEEALFVTLLLPPAKAFLSGQEYRDALATVSSLVAELNDSRPVYLRLAGEADEAA